jgi:hypothetical protein
MRLLGMDACPRLNDIMEINKETSLGFNNRSLLVVVNG